MHILDSSSDSLVLDLWRQTSPLNSAGSSPTPTSTGISSPLLHEGGAGASASVSSGMMMSKSDTMVGNHSVNTSSWGAVGGAGADSGDASAERGSKNLRSSGSQTDSLDSPGPSPRKDVNNDDHQSSNQDSKVRHSMPMLDKAKVTVEKIFNRSRHKSQEEKSKDKEGVVGGGLHSKQHMKVAEDCGTQVNLSQTEKVIAEFPNNPAASYGINNDRSSKSSRKREIEVDSNNGTWPKTRSQHPPSTSGPPTVIAPPGHKTLKARPSIKEVFYGPASAVTSSHGVTVHHSAQNSDSSVKYPSPEASSHGVTIHHSAQNSDSSIKYPNAPSYPPSSAAPSSSSAFSPANSAFSSASSSSGPLNSSPLSSAVTLPSSVSTQHVYSTSLTLTQPSTVSSSSSAAPLSLPPSSSSSKSQSHFTVGIMHGPGTIPPFPLGHHSPAQTQQPHNVGSYHHHTVVGPSRAKHSPGLQLYGTIPGPKHHQGGTLRGSLVSSHHPPHHPQAPAAHSHAIPQDFRFVDTASAIHPQKMTPRVHPVRRIHLCIMSLCTLILRTFQFA